jgi:hypothetical protein
MPTGTATPPAPSSDLIDRFNAIIDGLLAALVVESMKAAGVPWPLRMILAPLLRRRLARWSARFAAMVADARAGRRIEPALDVAAGAAADAGDGDPEADCQAHPIFARNAVRSASVRRDAAIARATVADASNAGALPDRREPRPDGPGRPHVQRITRIAGGVVRRRYTAARPSRRGGTSCCGPPAFFGAGSPYDFAPLFCYDIITNSQPALACAVRAV